MRIHKNNNTNLEKYKKIVNNIKCYSAKNRSTLLKKKKNKEIYSLISKNIQNVTEKLKKVDKLSNLYEKIDTFMKNEINIFREKKEQKRPKSHSTRNKKINKSIPTHRITSPTFYYTNETTTIKNNNKKSNISSKSNNDNDGLNYSTSTSQFSSNLKYFIHSPFLISTRNRNKSCRYILSKRACETSREIKKITHKTIFEANKIDHKIKKNYLNYKKPKEVFNVNKSSNDLLSDKYIDVGKIRKELKLKDSNGLLGKINEIEILENDLKNMGKRLNKKKYMDILTPVARGLIRQDLY